jgi:hypothetical protein
MKDKNFEGKIELASATTYRPYGYKAYAMLVALANYSTSFCGGRALYYLDVSNDFEEMEATMRGEGSFMSEVLNGNLIGALKRADSGNYKALTTALYYRELDL